MQPVTFDHDCYRIDGKPVFLHSGEFHYFRVPPEDWRRRMELFREAGGNCIATYVPWLLHEPREGEFAFTSEDRKLNLEEFLAAARDAGLYVVARPGPYQYSELVDEGLARWLKKDYPQLLAQRADGSSFRSISYVHPLLLEKVRAWFDAVCPILARHTVENGGPIAFVQLDNELTGVHFWYTGGPDYNREAMGIGAEGGRYPRFLAQRHGDLAALNRRYGTRYACFADVEPIEMNRSTTAEDLRRAKDYLDFYLGTCADYLAALAEMVRGHGIRVPLIHNSANPNMDAFYVETVERLGRELLIGSDHYYCFGQTMGSNNPTPQYACETFASNEMLRLYGFPPTILEMPGGAFTDFPPITAEDCDAAYRAHVALGMKGVNYYVLTGGPNVPDSCICGDVYDYNAAIGADGEVRPLYAVQKAFGRDMIDHAWIMDAAPEAGFRVPLHFEYARAGRYWKGSGPVPLGSDEAWEFVLRGLLVSAFSAGLYPRMENLAGDDWLAETATPVFVPCGSCLPAAGQERIVRFLRGGGKAVLGPVLPTHDEKLEPCTILADFLGVQPPRPARGPMRLSIAGVTNITGAHALAVPPGDLPAGAEVIGRNECTGDAAVFRVPTDGGGQAVVYAVRWAHSKHEHFRALAGVLGMLGAEPRVQSSNPHVWPVLRTKGDRSMLFLLSLYSSSMETRVRCRPAWSDDMIDLGPQHLPPMTVRMIELGKAR